MPHSPVSIPVREKARLRVTTASGRVIVVAEARADILVEQGLADGKDAVREEDGWTVLKPESRAGTIQVRVPEGCDLAIGTASARVVITGKTGAVHVTSASGRIDVGEAEVLDARAHSGGVHAGSIGRGRVQSVSGNVEIDSAGQAMATTVSGRVRIGWVSGEARVKAASGRIELGLKPGGVAAVESLSGSITVRVPKGCHPEVRARTRSGNPEIAVEAGTDCRLMVRSLSGRIQVTEQ